MTRRTLLSLVTVLSLVSSSFAQSYRNQDAATGGLAGAVIGGIIGHQNDETPEGALIGGAIGAIAGGLLGREKDAQLQHQRAYQHQAWQHRQKVIARAVTIDDVVSMAQSGISDSVIMKQIQTHGVVGHIGTHEIILMHKRGVSEPVITAMQAGRPAGAVTPRQPETIVVESPPPRPRPVVVHREVHVTPPPVYIPHPRVRYATRPAFPAYPSRIQFHRYW